MSMNISAALRTWVAQYAMAISSVAICVSFACGDDWPQWMGPQRDDVYRESGIAKEIPSGGFPVHWRFPIHGGYSGPSVSSGRLFVMDYVITAGKNTSDSNTRDSVNGTERVLCLDATTGKELWKVRYERPYNISYANGPRATPTVDGNFVYTLGAEGDLLCIEVASGTIVWRKQLAEAYKTQAPIWGYAAHPLIYEDLLITLAGGDGSVVVALDKLTGHERWRALSASEIGYCPPTIQKLGGTDKLIIWDADAIHSLEPKTGKLNWSKPLKPRYGMSITAPRLTGNLMFASGIGEVSALFPIDERGLPGESLWQGRPKIGVYCANSTPSFESNAIYGSDCGSGMMIAVNPQDGSRFWETFQPTTGGNRRAAHGTVFITKHEDRYLLFSETGDLIFARLTPERYEEIGRMHVLEPTSDAFGRPVVWSHPAFANRKMFVRNDKEIVCVVISAK
jgi:outer membrane protein assembly factor BamB